MDITHLHLHVRDRARSEAFYGRWFGLERRFGSDELAFLMGERQFLLALMHDPDAAPLPPWFHFGVMLESPAAVRDMLVRMQAAGVPIVAPYYEGPTVVSFRCADPDGYQIELYAAPDRRP
jgi:catechol 2,3-dioxygenase-like lactoylglutathione lyase family enzyme